MIEKFLHFLIPRTSNNHRARSLHFVTITIYLGIFLILQVFLEVTPNWQGKILGYATNINVSDLLQYTNQKRAENDLSDLNLNDKLNEAASLKAQNMFAEQYWAHTSPSGKDPWSFLNQVNYSYLYAGENLARDFADSRGVVDAWLNSPSHKENLLNSKYQEVGFAVVNGKYGDYETTLVVQMFGTKPTVAPSVTPAAPMAVKVVPSSPTVNSAATNQTPNPTPVQPNGPSETKVEPIPNQEVITAKTPNSRFILSSFEITKWVIISLGCALLIFLFVDAVVAHQRKALRFAGHNVAHFLLIVTVIIAVLSIKRGLVI